MCVNFSRFCAGVTKQALNVPFSKACVSQAFFRCELIGFESSLWVTDLGVDPTISNNKNPFPVD
jgi:hypothetical protein